MVKILVETQFFFFLKKLGIWTLFTQCIFHLSDLQHETLLLEENVTIYDNNYSMIV